MARASQHQKHLDEGEIEQLVAAYQGGSSVYELAEQFECNRETVSRRLKSRGVKMRHLTMTQEQIDVAERLYASGLSLAEVGGQIGVDPSTALRRLRGRGIVMQPPCIHHVNSAQIKD